ncbi:FAD-dependent oxidoreductase [Dactylosporangium sp. AC04546]|uniref:FAD-dependent oxidoreductase n=1 Tax=Dactylosporangium sp. AC04546 TaxID=2862460 RepID=UPI001EDC996B|nr:FAD-dependent oxidoreductase [Dactylosporangium sp. AC04546]WVK88651.1 FAD-dependent oxidoreductase [Dactylosporangium sp. AC04546]
MTEILVIGGGYGGITAAKALDDVADVTLVEPREVFVHNVAALRAVADPDWADRIFLPYDRLLSRGRVVRDRAVRVTATGADLASGAHLDADVIILATGSAMPFPARPGPHDRDRLAATHRALSDAGHVLLLGAGAVGLEFAGEIKAAWPAVEVTIADPAPDILGGRFPDEFRTSVREQLAALGVRLLLGSGAGQAPAADLTFACYGAAVDSSYLCDDLAAARQPDGRLAVTPQLRLPGHERVFAIGDLTAVPELKQARLAQAQAEVVAVNVRALLAGGPLTDYTPAPDAIVLQLGPKGGASYAPEVGVLGPAETAGIKATMFIESYEELLGIA